jgi:ribosome biogenesis GTPase
MVGQGAIRPALPADPRRSAEMAAGGQAALSPVQYRRMTLADLGWGSFFEAAFAPFTSAGWVPARLTRETPVNFGALLDQGAAIEVVVAGKVWHEAATDAELPAVGDWVAVELGTAGEDHVIRARLPRRTCFSRKVPGKSTEEQVIGANVDVVAVITDAGPDFNLRRIERYFTLIERSGARGLVLVNKADLFPAEQNRCAAAAIAALWQSAAVLVTSALHDEGLGALHQYLTPGTTMCIVGSSGVGKSTLVNRLLGRDWQWTAEVNEVTGKGRHTTAQRELVPLPGGAILLDNPGLREVQMWTDEQTLRESFAEVEELAARCRWGDCKHQADDGCAIRAAVEAGQLAPGRLESFLRLDDEIARLRQRHKKRRMAVERWAKRNRKVKARNLADRIELEQEQRPERW